MALPSRASLLLGSLLVLAAAGGLSLEACFSGTVGPTPDAGDAGADGADAADAMTDTPGESLPCTPNVFDGSLTTPTARFSTDVAPLFNKSCALGESSCHGDPSVKTAGRPFLGLTDGGAPPAEIIAAIVGVPSVEDPAMNEVTKGDPSKSFLMHKLDNDQACFAADCANNGTPYTDCGGLMPSLNPELDQPTRDAVRRWIAQGANND